MPLAAALPIALGAADVLGGIFGSVFGSGAADDAADAQVEMMEQAAKLQRQNQRDSITYSWPWYSGGVAAQNQLLNLMGLGSQVTADTATGTAGGYVDPATAMMEAEKIRTGIKDQLQAGRGSDRLENTLLRLQQQKAKAEARGRTDQAASIDQQIAAIQGQIDSSANPLYNLEGIKNPQKILRKMTDLELYRTFGPGGQYSNAQSGTGGDGTTTTTPADTSQTGLQQSALQMFQTDPGYLFRLQEAEKAILRNRAATGGAQSGATLKALDRYAQDYASNEYGNYYNRLAALAGQGQVQTNQNNTLNTNATNTISNYSILQGQARASGYINQANAITGGINSTLAGLGGVFGNWGGGNNGG